jgi:hypothetical protein
MYVFKDEGQEDKTGPVWGLAPWKGKGRDIREG